jgi:hypothetical protein
MVRISITLLFILLTSCASKSRPGVCEVLKLKYCNDSKRSLNRSAGASLPSVNSAAFNNPAAISLSKGLGVESIHYNGKAQLGIITGTGRIGAAISNFPNDGTFFGNSAIETTNEFRKRSVEFGRLEQDKLILAGAFNLFGGDSNKGLQADIGIIYRRHTVLEKDYYGGGIILSYNKIISLGASFYDDAHYSNKSGQKDTLIDANGNQTTVYYPTNLNLNVETTYKVSSYVAGLKFSKLALDYITFRTKSDDNSVQEVEVDAEVDIYNLSYFYKTWIFSYGRRFETSFKEVYKEEIFIEQENKSNTFLGAQYATSNGFLLGGFINYYLLGELSLGLTYFF